MTEWRTQARAALGVGPTALVTVLATEGSAPRGPGARMLVLPEGQHGTIGGGALEHQAAAQARAILDLPRGSWRVQDYPLGPLLGQCCGGRVRLLIERLEAVPEETGPYRVTLGDHIGRISAAQSGGSCEGQSGPGAHAATLSARGPRPEAGASFIEPVDDDTLPVLMFGAGHVGQAIAERARGLPLHIGWYDARPDYGGIEGVVHAEPEDLAKCAAAASAETAVVILTHDHALDYLLAAAALGGEARYVGLIGSRTKRARFDSRFAKDGVSAARLDCPIGIPGVKGKEPEVIALSILARLLQLRGAA